MMGDYHVRFCDRLGWDSLCLFDAKPLVLIVNLLCMGDNPLGKYISYNQLTPCMNNTKWREHVKYINTIHYFARLVHIKLAHEDSNNVKFLLVCWHEVEMTDTI